ncbi:MAG: hypothetical protein N2748_03180 [candidate division WOR-3 bacterium]|nr:hypothetical protein [candidate division WOR-3 bacterium]
MAILSVRRLLRRFAPRKDIFSFLSLRAIKDGVAISSFNATDVFAWKSLSAVVFRYLLFAFRSAP